MADNYLEKRMEELRSGKFAVRNARPGFDPKGKKVLVAIADKKTATTEILRLRKDRHRVAVFHPDRVWGKEMAYKHGVRYHCVDVSDEEAVEKEIEILKETWRRIDGVFTDSVQ